MHAHHARHPRGAHARSVCPGLEHWRPRVVSGQNNNMAEFYSSGKEFGSTYDSQAKIGFKAFEIAPVIERIVTTSADRPKTVG